MSGACRPLRAIERAYARRDIDERKSSTKQSASASMSMSARASRASVAPESSPERAFSTRFSMSVRDSNLERLIASVEHEKSSTPLRHSAAASALSVASQMWRGP
eukprot:3348945-Prymnesium_polylepis.1